MIAMMAPSRMRHYHGYHCNSETQRFNEQHALELKLMLTPIVIDYQQRLLAMSGLERATHTTLVVVEHAQRRHGAGAQSQNCLKVVGGGEAQRTAFQHRAQRLQVRRLILGHHHQVIGTFLVVAQKQVFHHLRGGGRKNFSIFGPAKGRLSKI